MAKGRYVVEVERTVVYRARYELLSDTEADAVNAARLRDTSADLDSGDLWDVQRSTGVKAFPAPSPSQQSETGEGGAT